MKGQENIYRVRKSVIFMTKAAVIGVGMGLRVPLTCSYNKQHNCIRGLKHQCLTSVHTVHHDLRD